MSYTNTNHEEEFTKHLKKQQNNFNHLIEKALDLDVIIEKKFDVKKYLPKNELYDSKILRKYQGVLNKKDSDRVKFKEIIKEHQSISDIECSIVEEEGEQSTFNYNFMTSIKEKDDRLKEKNMPYAWPMFEMFIEEIDYDYNDYKEVNNNKQRNEIDILNEEISNKTNKNNHNENNYMWYCLNYKCDSNNNENNELLSIENQFLSYKL